MIDLGRLELKECMLDGVPLIEGHNMKGYYLEIVVGIHGGKGRVEEV